MMMNKIYLKTQVKTVIMMTMMTKMKKTAIVLMTIKNRLLITLEN